MKLSSRLEKLPPIPTLAMNTKAGELRAKGVDVISFAAGEPDFDTPDHIKEAASKALFDGETKYTAVKGIPSLREEICNWILDNKGVSYDPEKEVVVTVGGKQSVFNSLHCLLEEGDEVVIPSPIWVAYEPVANLTGAKVVLVEAKEENAFKATADDFKKAITPKTKLVVINSPCNPTGCVYTRSELEKLSQVILDSNAMILSDEIYGKILYDGEEHISIASISEEMKDKTLILDGFSKTYAMTGWRMGYTLGPAKIIKAMDTLQGQSTSNVTTFAQYGGIAALKGSHDFLDDWIEKYDERRKKIVEGLRSIDGIDVVMPKGAFYVFPRINGLFGLEGPDGVLQNSVDVGLFFLEHARCAAVPGAGFGDDNFIRFSYATSTENILEGIDRIRSAVSMLK